MCGAKLYLARKNYIEKLSQTASVIHKEICNETLTFEYKCGINISNNGSEKEIYEDFLKELKFNLLKDKQFEMTNYGCHRDDFKIFINETDSKFYASQGQQRTCAIALKMAQLKMLENFYNDTPVLLLDDVLSELDEDRQNYILNNIKGIQTIITCTNTEKFTGQANLIDVSKIGME